MAWSRARGRLSCTVCAQHCLTVSSSVPVLCLMLMALTSTGPCMSMSVISIDPLFPFQPWSVIVSHLVISHSLDIFHSFLAIPYTFSSRNAPDLAARSQSRLLPPREPRMREALGSPLPSTGFFGVNRYLLAISMYRNNQFFLLYFLYVSS
jgi:hypothetical protein